MMIVIKDTEDYREDDVNLFGECERVLEVMSAERIFKIYRNEKTSKFAIVEGCDQYFGTVLTSEMCRDLSELFLKISAEVENIK